ncbi:hypothetical protein [Sporosarcina sp. Te-1]|uniref:hypothetical protein n=1 Tax=Sporosarcina sp. Te-1 TaxID=2818390 RepID=UPI001A9D7F83|nr:hypothetical protein [Sporosarcina sp. Te-1]QTD40134.1 hypothetical protein J3U78_15075 [Sporosarcina sp. Te-1]
MFDFFGRNKLVKDDLKGIAKLMYQDVSEDAWDQENLTKRNLDFSIESIRIIDLYAKRLMGTELLHQHFDNFVVRIGAYVGEVINNNCHMDFCWYEFQAVYDYSPVLHGSDQPKEPYTLLYAKKEDAAILPLWEAAERLKGTSAYPNFLSYVEDMVQNYS